MSTSPGESEDSKNFLTAFLRRDEEGRELSERLNAGRLVVLLSALLMVSVEACWPEGAGLENLSAYARSLLTQRENYPRSIVLEGVLRAGAGERRILDGLPEDEVLLATAIVIRRLVGDLEARAVPSATLIERAVELVRTGSVESRER